MHCPVAIRGPWDRIGGLSNPSKMPGMAYSTPAIDCIAGSELFNIPGSVCRYCYARRGRYLFPVVQRALQRRLESLSSPTWANDFVAVLEYMRTHKRLRYFRWHDSGDLQSLEHLERIIEVARRTPQIRHWLPTREYRMACAVAAADVPENLCIRVSAAMIDGAAPELGLPTSTVTTTTKSVSALCRAYTRGGKCGNCRLCWQPNVKNVAYPKH